MGCEEVRNGLSLCSARGVHKDRDPTGLSSSSAGTGKELGTEGRLAPQVWLQGDEAEKGLGQPPEVFKEQRHP